MMRKAKVMLVYANDRMDNLVSIAPSQLAPYVKRHGHEFRLYDTTFIDEGKEVGDVPRIRTLQLKPKALSEVGLYRTKMTTPELQANFRRTIQEWDPDIIGFSSLEITYDQTARLIDGIKDLPIPIIVGGMYATFAPQQVMKNPYVDMICEGEGELAFEELVNKIAKYEDVSKFFDIRKNGSIQRSFNPPREIIETLNISTRFGGNNGNHKFYRSGIESKLEEFASGDFLETDRVSLTRPNIDMNQLLVPDYTILEDKRFIKPMSGEIWRAICIEGARGCPYKCRFCCIPQMQKHDSASENFRGRVREGEFGEDILELLRNHDGPESGHHRQKHPRKLVNEVLDAVEKHNINYVFLADETFLAQNPKWLGAFFEEWDRIRLPPGTLPRSYVEAHPRFVRKDGTEKMPYFTQTRVETLCGSKRVYAKMLEESGCELIACGIESGDPVYRAKFLERRMDDVTIIEGFRALGETDMRISANNIIGMPMETREDIFNTIRINRVVNPDNIIVNAFRPYTGTPLREDCIALGLIKPGIRAEDNRSLEQFYNGVLTAKEIEGLRRTFVLYVTFPEERWPEIKEAEQNDDKFNELSREFYSENLLDRNNRKCLMNLYDSSERSRKVIELAGIQPTDPQ